MADRGAGTLSGLARPLRVVFVCTQNRLRSPTAEAIFRTHPEWEVASAGTARDADTALTRDLLEWADVAVCMEKAHRDWIRARWRGVLPDDRLLTLGIPDDYEFMDAELVALLERLVPARLAGKGLREGIGGSGSEE
ncbi:phosphotyrosine protein phosphatase [Deinococcus sp. YIM 134068]|uniref:low molecular weight protein tyrosine phosphatase family protein n=1 Tax=Deinococcus lichenicola TaxID=3118910 RepID=UPI002F94E2A0